MAALRSSAGGSGAPLFSNSKQYRAQSTPHQSNRSGSATLTSRALLGKNGNTVLEVTTGSLGVSSAPGNIAKLQLKFADPQGTKMATRNYNGLSGGYQTLTLTGLMRHGSIQTQGNVRDIDPKRTDVVTISERVNLRPDLAVVGLTAPDRVRPNQELVITADVKELNGDVGAFDDCVLYVAGSEQERIVGQWVADGDMVTCAFKHTFANPGTYDLTVKSENVKPGDWDLANNSASRSIEVVNPEVELHGYAYMQNWQWSHRYVNYGSWYYTNYYGYSGRWDHRYLDEGHFSYAYFYASAPSGGPMASATMSITDQNGVTLASVGGAVNGATCSYQYGSYGYDWFNSCSDQFYTWTNGGHYSGVAVYYARGFDERCYDGYCYSYDYNYANGPNVWGSGLASTGPMTINIRVEGTNGSIYKANPTIPVLYTQTNNGWWYGNQPLTCTTYDEQYWYGYHSEQCYESSSTSSYEWGSINF